MTPWHIRSVVLWTMWSQYCDHDLHSGCFHVGVALFCSWKITIQAGMGACYELQRHRKKRSAEKHAAMEHHFLHI